MKNRKTRAPSRIRIRQTESILLAAGELFFSKGYTATSIEDIASAADVNKASIYYYFQSKNQMLFQISKKAMDELLDMARPIAELDLPPEQKLEQLVRGHINWQVSRPGFAGIGQLESRNMDPKSLRAFIAMRDQYEAIYREVISSIIRQSGRRADPALFTRLSLGMLNSIIRWYKPRGKKSAQEIAGCAYGFIMSSIAGPEFEVHQAIPGTELAATGNGRRNYPAAEAGRRTKTKAKRVRKSPVRIRND